MKDPAFVSLGSMQTSSRTPGKYARVEQRQEQYNAVMSPVFRKIVYSFGVS